MNDRIMVSPVLQTPAPHIDTVRGIIRNMLAAGGAQSSTLRTSLGVNSSTPVETVLAELREHMPRLRELCAMLQNLPAWAEQAGQVENFAAALDDLDIVKDGSWESIVWYARSVMQNLAAIHFVMHQRAATSDDACHGIVHLVQATFLKVVFFEYLTE